MTENYYDVLLGYANELCDGEGARLYNLKEVADFIQTNKFGLITDTDGDILLEFDGCKIENCRDMVFKYELIAELRKGEGFDDRNAI